MLGATVEIIETVAPYALALVLILGIVGLVIWVFQRWNREPPV